MHTEKQMEKNKLREALSNRLRRAESNGIIPAQSVGPQPKCGITKYSSPPNDNLLQTAGTPDKSFGSITKPQHQPHQDKSHNATQRLCVCAWSMIWLSDSRAQAGPRSVTLPVYSAVCFDRSGSQGQHPRTDAGPDPNCTPSDTVSL